MFSLFSVHDSKNNAYDCRDRAESNSDRDILPNDSVADSPDHPDHRPYKRKF